MVRIITASVFTLSLLTFVACDPQSDVTGVWKLELVDADSCMIRLDIEQNGEEIVGKADLKCTLYFDIDGGTYTYDMKANDETVEGEYDFEREEFEIDFEFYDSLFDETIEITLEGEVIVDEMEGDVLLAGEEWGEFEGELG